MIVASFWAYVLSCDKTNVEDVGLSSKGAFENTLEMCIEGQMNILNVNWCLVNIFKIAFDLYVECWHYLRIALGFQDLWDTTTSIILKNFEVPYDII